MPSSWGDRSWEMKAPRGDAGALAAAAVMALLMSRFPFEDIPGPSVQAGREMVGGWGEECAGWREGHEAGSES